MIILKELLKFFYPYNCEVCGRLLLENEEILCSYCYLDLPRTNFHQYPEDNPVAEGFWGRVNISRASSYFFFHKGSFYQVLLHRLKYEGQKQIGIVLGKNYATELAGSPFLRADFIIPVPLYLSRQRKRGYNQSAMIGSGISEFSGIPLMNGILIRTCSTESQTRKNRFDRFLNMEGKFSVTDNKYISGKHILLIDDVITTGSTLESCAQELLDEGCREISILSLAVA